MKVVMKTSDVMANLRIQKAKLLKLSPSNAEVRREVEELVREMTRFRLENPAVANVVMEWEVELLDGFPGLDPDDQ
jgi:hypothetical protein